jgi:NAD(P)-dependent dehydrogenase (short-subunit alcohol dehydrogenase family)
MQTKRKTMIVTGAGRGIGAAVTNAFIKRGYNVVGNALNITGSVWATSARWVHTEGLRNFEVRG